MPDKDLEFANAPNFLTLLRMALVPGVVYFLWDSNPESNFYAALLFVIASITDFFDGYVARSQNLVTIYGKLMDPLADKFLVVSALIMLQYLDRIHPIVVILLVCRELGITGLRALASAEGVIIPAGWAGKLKTTTQMIAIPLIMLPEGLAGFQVYDLGIGMLYVSIGMSLWSALTYSIDFFKSLRATRLARHVSKSKKKRRPRKRAKL